MSTNHIPAALVALERLALLAADLATAQLGRPSPTRIASPGTFSKLVVAAAQLRADAVNAIARVDEPTLRELWTDAAIDAEADVRRAANRGGA